MPYRDPETGRFVAHDDHDHDHHHHRSFADHDIHHIRHDLRFLPSADAGPNVVHTEDRDWEITERGLDPDELAELVGLRVSATIGTDVDPISQDEIGHITGWFQTGFNLSGDEFLVSQGTQATEDFDVDGSGTADFRSFTRDTDEVGQLTADRLDGYLGYSDTTDGTGGAGGMPELNYVLNFRQMFGMGPIVDAADDFSTMVGLDINNVVAGATAKMTVSAYYEVEEYEHGRSRFGR